MSQSYLYCPPPPNWETEGTSKKTSTSPSYSNLTQLKFAFVSHKHTRRPKSCTFFNTPYLWNRSRQTETDGTFWQNPFRFILNGSKDIVWWKNCTTFWGPPCVLVKLFTPPSPAAPGGNCILPILPPLLPISYPTSCCMTGPCHQARRHPASRMHGYYRNNVGSSSSSSRR